MKKIYLFLVVSLLFASCSKNESNEELLTSDLSTSLKTYVLNHPSISTCPSDTYTPKNNDVEITFSENLPYKTVLEFKAYEKISAGFAEVPGFIIVIEAGENSGVIDTSCDLPGRIQCGTITELRSKDYRIKFHTASYSDPNANGATFDFVPEYDDFIDVTAYKYCFVPGGGGGPGGL